MSTLRPLVVRWTIGDVSAWGFEALQYSLWSAWNIFGSDSRFVVCVNTIALDQARELTGEVPEAVEWRDVTGDMSELLRPYLDPYHAEGVGWKFAPLRISPDDFELALDNDCILWDVPEAIQAWLAAASGSVCVIAEDVQRMLGVFEHLCGPEPRNSGIRGLPPGFDLGRALERILQQHPVMLTSELDEQGLQVAALEHAARTLVVGVDEVTICSPFPPHRSELGRCGAHFVGLNAKELPWSYDGRSAVEHIRDHWRWHLPELRRRVGLPTDAPLVLTPRENAG